MIGFYQERGGEVQAIMYRDVYESRLVTRTREERVWIPSTEDYVMVLIPGRWQERTIEIPGRWEDRAVRISEHEEEQLVEIPGYYQRQHVQEPGHYEIKPVWFEEHTITKYYWREAHPARGLEAAWIPYEEIVPAGFSDTRVWVEGEWRTKVVWVDTTWEYQTVTVPEAWGTERVWVEPVSVSRKVWWPSRYVEKLIGEPGRYETQVIEYYETVEVWNGYEPVYSFVDETQVTLFEVLELYEGAGPGPEFEDVITIRNRLTGEELRTTAKYLGMATRIEENEYVVP